jgi:Flp pilus assembly protein TadB
MPHAVLLQFIPTWATKYGATGILAFVLAYVLWKFVIRRNHSRIRELEEENQELRDELLDARKDKWRTENEELRERIDNLLRRINTIKNND